MLKQPGAAVETFGIADALDVARTVAWAVGVELTVRQTSHPALHPGRAASLLVGDTVVGVAGELLPERTADADLPRVVAVVELDLDALVAVAPRTRARLGDRVLPRSDAGPVPGGGRVGARR
ncbi:hypothetical protein DEJ36_06925 [Curtobacterium sp. MCPF17_052]|nr:hypothetical protein [Curtobacterium sp. MCPF17_052]WIB13498.1 hypothetical protein DEJ36_06925 [Curtobacterium sp. MCPF17_052]